MNARTNKSRFQRASNGDSAEAERAALEEEHGSHANGWINSRTYDAASLVNKWTEMCERKGDKDNLIFLPLYLIRLVSTF